MNRWKAVGILCVAAACLAMVLSGCAPQSYTPPAKEQKVSSSALTKAGTLRVGVNAATTPLAGRSEGSVKIIGIDVDVAAYIADQMGLKLEVVDVGTNPEKALADGTVDMVMGIDSAETEGSFWKSTPYVTSGVALFAPSSTVSAPPSGSTSKIAAQASTKSSWRVTNLYGEGTLVTENDLKSAFAAMSTGAAEFVAADALAGTFAASSGKLQASIVALLQDPSGYCIAVGQSNTELQAAVSSAVESLSSGGIMNIIESKWLGAPLNLANVPVVKAASTDSSASSGASASSEASSSEPQAVPADQVPAASDPQIAVDGAGTDDSGEEG